MWSSSVRRSTPTARRRQFDACEPENRLVARSLEREWEQRLTDVRRAEHPATTSLSGALTRSATKRSRGAPNAGADLRKLFDAPSTTDRERKHLLRAILFDVL